MDEEGRAYVPDNEVLLEFLKYGYILGDYVPTLKHVDVENSCLRESAENKKKLQQVFGIDSFGAAKKRRNRFMLGSSDVGERDRLWLAKVSVILWMSIRGDIESQKFSFLQYQEVTRPIEIVDEMLGGVYLQWSTHDAVDHSKARATNAAKWSYLNTGKWFGMERSRMLKACLNIRVAYDDSVSFTHTVLWTLLQFYVCRFYKHS